jgi:selenocysteine-specific translation elongation factor
MNPFITITKTKEVSRQQQIYKPHIYSPTDKVDFHMEQSYFHYYLKEHRIIVFVPATAQESLIRLHQRAA